MSELHSRVVQINQPESTMSMNNLSSVATHVINAYGITATNFINTYRYGGERVVGLVDKGLRLGADRAQSAVGVAVDLATKGVSMVASNARRIDRSVNLNALDKLNRVVMPAATVLSNVAERIEEGSTELVKRVAGKPIAAKAVATRRLNATTRKAMATRKEITKAATQQVNKAVATRKKVTKSVTQQVGKAVADTATQTSNAARRVARKAEGVANAA